MKKNSARLIVSVLVVAVVAIAFKWTLERKAPLSGPAATLPAIPRQPLTAAGAAKLLPRTARQTEELPVETRPVAERSPAPPAGDSPAMLAPSAPARTEKSIAELPGSTPRPAMNADPVQTEVLGTIRMYRAHAPLRTSTVANPDSAENQEILRTMVNKALARSSRT